MTFLRNLIADMWERRLLPVAILLIAVAGGAVLFMKKDASEPPHVTRQAAGKTASALSPDDIPLTIDDVANEAANVRDVKTAWARKDPFLQQARAGAGGSEDGTVTPKDEGTGGTGGRSSQLGLDGSGSSGETSSGSGGEGGSGGSVTSTSGSSGGSATSGGSSSTVDSGSTGTTTVTGGGGTSESEEPRYFDYMLDVTVTHGEKTKHYDRLAPMTVLPSKDEALMTFLGVDKKSRALFLVSPAARQHGEGECLPSKYECTMVRMEDSEKRDEHVFFTDPATKSKIDIDDVRAVEVDPGEVSSKALSAAALRALEAGGGSSETGGVSAGGGADRNRPATS